MFWLRENANVSVHSLVLQYHRNVRYGSKADIALAKSDVRFTPKSGHCRATFGCPLCADFVAKVVLHR